MRLPAIREFGGEMHVKKRSAEKGLRARKGKKTKLHVNIS